MALIIGLVGQKGSGKGTFIDLLRDIAPDKKIVRVGSVDVLKETLALWDIPQNRRNLQDLAIIMDQRYGIGSLSHAVQLRIEQIDADIVVFDGIRWDTDVAVLRSFNQNFLVYVTADVKTRYTRTKTRHEKVGEDTTTYEQFVEEEKVATELKIADIGAVANVKIDNGGSLDEYKTQVTEVYKELLEPRTSNF
ncbi:MAG: hypothetical protein RL094_795 [Candidatus Parcubacteria bacterium]|jgi:dephospho-CoA kinase